MKEINDYRKRFIALKNDIIDEIIERIKNKGKECYVCEDQENYISVPCDGGAENLLLTQIQVEPDNNTIVLTLDGFGDNILCVISKNDEYSEITLDELICVIDFIN